MTQTELNEIARSFMLMMLADSRSHKLIDSYTNGRLILSALYEQLGYTWPNHESARKELLKALGHSQND